MIRSEVPWTVVATGKFAVVLSLLMTRSRDGLYSPFFVAFFVAFASFAAFAFFVAFVSFAVFALFVAFDCRLFLTARGVRLPVDAGDTGRRRKGLARFTIGC